MKKILILVSIFIIVSFASVAQDLHKNDPGYHINNYKHPNKANHAAKKNTKTIDVSENVVVNRNYKQMGTKTSERALEIVRTDLREVYLTRQNYKMPFNTVKKAKLQIASKTDTIENSID